MMDGGIDEEEERERERRRGDIECVSEWVREKYFQLKQTNN